MPDEGLDRRPAPAWLTPSVRGIGFASLLADLGYEVPTSLLPALLTSVLGAPAAALGLIEGIADAAAGIAKLGGGALADDPHRRRDVAVGGYAATAVLCSLIARAPSCPGAASGLGVRSARRDPVGLQIRPSCPIASQPRLRDCRRVSRQSGSCVA